MSGSAFTLLELLIVVSILAIVAALVVPMIGNRADLRLDAAARKLSADLQFAQAMAITTQRQHMVRFTVTASPAVQQYEIVHRRDQHPAPLGAVAHPVERTGSFIVRFNNAATPELNGIALGAVVVGTGTSTLAFDSMGTPRAYNESTGNSVDLTGPLNIVLSSAGMSRTVSVAPFTGEVTVSN